ncbi:MAG: type II toxin-antitoxin system PemK/MazF family toxin [Candidatus Jettenia sp.]|nr:type II toxin-antitoxin system PemK/MazF family toxin [Candidatus Jettenia sp. AMX1]MBC6929729.1 type II toxin-antitoxin system PemK/MazF family toxin [Candidatus Jettenia sp.]NUN23750.1 type II toxin-antitoxin system PemK/MazF family toxin [Candidatus Jettenia caeni]KAA0248730.1 MAG: type II toxin-antitoxin system PemK/MazF family toxin [Candidatus Jettenia sp. AMX1]MCE7880645.1 type II toxin-antitoxin system PemK/MazF family toxin [Candidatus Jettenia sp. AMX1]MCQ3927389.1 type II toxin-a
MTIFNKGDVILIPFPFTDLSATKQRPALIISSDQFNNNHKDVIVMAISSQVPSQVPEDEYLLSSTDLKTSGLPKKSIIKLGKVVTINQSLIIKKLGKIPNQTIASILNQFNTSIVSNTNV